MQYPPIDVFHYIMKHGYKTPSTQFFGPECGLRIAFTLGARSHFTKAILNSCTPLVHDGYHGFEHITREVHLQNYSIDYTKWPMGLASLYHEEPFLSKFKPKTFESQAGVVNSVHRILNTESLLTDKLSTCAQQLWTFVTRRVPYHEFHKRVFIILSGDAYQDLIAFASPKHAQEYFKCVINLLLRLSELTRESDLMFEHAVEAAMRISVYVDLANTAPCIKARLMYALFLSFQQNILLPLLSTVTFTTDFNKSFAVQMCNNRPTTLETWAKTGCIERVYTPCTHRAVFMHVENVRTLTKETLTMDFAAAKHPDFWNVIRKCVGSDFARHTVTCPVKIMEDNSYLLHRLDELDEFFNMVPSQYVVDVLYNNDYFFTTHLSEMHVTSATVIEPMVTLRKAKPSNKLEHLVLCAPEAQFATNQITIELSELQNDYITLFKIFPCADNVKPENNWRTGLNTREPFLVINPSWVFNSTMINFKALAKIFCVAFMPSSVDYLVHCEKIIHWEPTISDTPSVSLGPDNTLWEEAQLLILEDSYPEPSENAQYLWDILLTFEFPYYGCIYGSAFYDAHIYRSYKNAHKFLKKLYSYANNSEDRMCVMSLAKTFKSRRMKQCTLKDARLIYREVFKLFRRINPDREIIPNYVKLNPHFVLHEQRKRLCLKRPTDCFGEPDFALEALGMQLQKHYDILEMCVENDFTAFVELCKIYGNNVDTIPKPANFNPLTAHRELSQYLGDFHEIRGCYPHYRTNKLIAADKFLGVESSQLVPRAKIEFLQTKFSKDPLNFPGTGYKLLLNSPIMLYNFITGSKSKVSNKLNHPLYF